MGDQGLWWSNHLWWMCLKGTRRTRPATLLKPWLSAILNHLLMSRSGGQFRTGPSLLIGCEKQEPRNQYLGGLGCHGWSFRGFRISDGFGDGHAVVYNLSYMHACSHSSFFFVSFVCFPFWSLRWSDFPSLPHEPQFLYSLRNPLLHYELQNYFKTKGRLDSLSLVIFRVFLWWYDILWCVCVYMYIRMCVFWRKMASVYFAFI